MNVLIHNSIKKIICHRNDVFSDAHMKIKVSKKLSHRRRQSLQEHHSTSVGSKLPHPALQRDSSERTRTVSLSGRQSWSPDRKTIDAQLNEMKRRVSMDVSALD